MKTTVSDEWFKIRNGVEDGLFDEYEDLEAAYDTPLWHEEFASESILHLLNAHIEKQPFHIAAAGGRIKRRDILRSPNYGALRRRVEESTGLSLDELEGWAEYTELRDIVNSLKHGSGNRVPDPSRRDQGPSRRLAAISA